MGIGRLMFVQAIINTLFFVATCTVLTYTLVRLAMGVNDPYRKYVISAVTVFFIIWFTSGCIIYLAFCRTFHRRCRSVSSDNVWLPQSDVIGQGRGMEVLPREPPVQGGVTAASLTVPAYKQPDCNPSDSAPECAVCCEEVEQRETMKRFPECLHVFHQRCFDWWLRRHSTCLVCRTDAFAPVLDVPYGLTV